MDDLVAAIVDLAKFKIGDKVQFVDAKFAIGTVQSVYAFVDLDGGRGFMYQVSVAKYNDVIVRHHVFESEIEARSVENQ